MEELFDEEMFGRRALDGSLVSRLPDMPESEVDVVVREFLSALRPEDCHLEALREVASREVDMKRAFIAFMMRTYTDPRGRRLHELILGGKIGELEFTPIPAPRFGRFLQAASAVQDDYGKSYPHDHRNFVTLFCQNY